MHPCQWLSAAGRGKHGMLNLLIWRKVLWKVDEETRLFHETLIVESQKVFVNIKVHDKRAPGVFAEVVTGLLHDLSHPIEGLLQV